MALKNKDFRLLTGAPPTRPSGKFDVEAYSRHVDTWARSVQQDMQTLATVVRELQAELARVEGASNG